jgi:type 1 glutamine amidotransferase
MDTAPNTYSALIIWGGWEGHDPERVASFVALHLSGLGCKVEVLAGVEGLVGRDLEQYDLIVPVWSLGIQHPAAQQAVLAAVEQGVGLAAFHGGIDWFADREYARMIGGHFIFHPPSSQYWITVEDTTHPIVQGIDSFEVDTEQYYFHLDPANHIITSTRFGEVYMPNTWIRTHGHGRVFYCSLAHTIEVLEEAPVRKLLLQGMQWAARRELSAA